MVTIRDDMERPDGIPRVLGRLLTQHDGPARLDPGHGQGEALLDAEPAAGDQLDPVAEGKLVPFPRISEALRMRRPKRFSSQS